MTRHKISLAATLALLTIGSAAQAQSARIEDVLSSVTLDFNNDAERDRAVLVQGEDGDADLYLYLGGDSTKPDTPGMKLALLKKGIVSAGPTWGQMPSLAVNGKGSLVIHSENSAIGRTKWSEALTVIYKDGQFSIVGVTYQTTDGLDPKASGSCDLNLLSGRGLRNGKPVTLQIKPIPLADWSDDKLPKECAF